MNTLRTSAFLASGGALALCLILSPATFAQQKPDTQGDKPAGDHVAAPTEPSAPTATTATPTQSGATSEPATNPNAPMGGTTAQGSPSPEIHVATKDAENRSDRKLSGREVKGSDGKELGNIKDFLVDPTSGRVDYAVISTGGIAGIGDKLRLVPLSALKPGSDSDEFRVEMEKSAWDGIAALSDDAFKQDKFTMTEAERGQITQRFGHAAISDAASPYSSGLTSHLIRASDLHKRDVRAQNEAVGSIEGIVIDLDKGTGVALLDPERDFAGSDQKFLVPLRHFSFATKKEPAATNLTRDQFSQAAGTSLVSAASTGTFPAATTTSEPSTSATTNAVQASTATTPPSDLSATMTGRDTSQMAGATDRSSTTAANPDPAARSDDAATSQSKQSKSSASVATTNQTSSNQGAAIGTAGKPPAIAGTQSDNQTISRTPANRNEQGQDVATTAPASPSSKSEGADLAATSKHEPSLGTDSTNPYPQSPAGVAATSTPPRTGTGATTPDANDPGLTPTGKTSAEQFPAGADPALISTAQDVRKALDENPALAGLGITVVPQHGKVVLRGSVNSNQLKTSAEQAAQHAAKDNEIDSQLTVEIK